MFKKGNKTVFKNAQKLNRLMNLRIFGFSENSLSLLPEFRVDRTAVIYHFKKYNIEQPEIVYDIPRIVASIIPPTDTVWIEIDGERINQGRSYADYLNLSHRKKTLIN